MDPRSLHRKSPVKYSPDHRFDHRAPVDCSRICHHMYGNFGWPRWRPRESYQPLHRRLEPPSSSTQRLCSPKDRICVYHEHVKRKMVSLFFCKIFNLFNKKAHCTVCSFCFYKSQYFNTIYFRATQIFQRNFRLCLDQIF